MINTSGERKTVVAGRRPEVGWVRTSDAGLAQVIKGLRQRAGCLDKPPFSRLAAEAFNFGNKLRTKFIL